MSEFDRKPIARRMKGGYGKLTFETTIDGIKIRSRQDPEAMLVFFSNALTDLQSALDRIGKLESMYIHYFVASAENDRFCQTCGEYLTDQLHTRSGNE